MKKSNLVHIMQNLMNLFMFIFSGIHLDLKCMTKAITYIFSHKCFRWKCSRDNVEWLCWVIFAGNLGSLGCGHLWDIKGNPQISARASVLAIVENSCVFGKLFRFLLF